MSHGVCAALDAVCTLVAESKPALTCEVPTAFAVNIVVATPFSVLAGFRLRVPSGAPVKLNVIGSPFITWPDPETSVYVTPL